MPMAASETPTFAGLPARGDVTPKVAVLGAPHATPYERGRPSHAAAAPEALRRAIGNYGRNPAHYDFDLGGTPLAGAVDCGDVAGDPADAAGNRARIEEAMRRLHRDGIVPVVLGGDDSVPIPVLASYEGMGPVTVVQIDAHLDWRDEVDGERYGYSSPMRRASEMRWVERLVQVGLRGVGSARKSDVDDALASGAQLVTAAEVHQHGIGRALERVPAGARCFVTIDCDGLDPAIMPAVIAPAPGGLSYWHVVQLLHGLADRAVIVGADLVEFVPSRDPSGLAALTAARIVVNAIQAILRSHLKTPSARD
jgi:agmatinase